MKLKIKKNYVNATKINYPHKHWQNNENKND